jgi:hypothetical protein
MLVMDVVNSLVTYATVNELLHPLAIQQARHRVSYADDVIILRPQNLDLADDRG